MLDVECQPGSQRKVGRPRRPERVFEHKVVKSMPISSDVRSRKEKKGHHQSLMSHQSTLYPGGRDDRSVPILVTPRTSYPPITLYPSTSIRSPKEPLSLLMEPVSWQLLPSTPNQRVRINSNGSSPTDQYIATIMPPLSSSSDDTSDLEPDWPDIATIPASIHANSLAWLAPPGQETRYFNHEATGELYFDTRLRTVTNDRTSIQHNPTNHSETPDIADTLSRIRKDMDLRRAIIRRNKSVLSLDTLIYRQSPLFIGNYTLSEFLISTSQDFLQVLVRLQASRRWKPSPSFHATAASPERLPHALAHTISSIFSQLVSFYELFLEHLTSRIEHISTFPVAPIPGLTLNGKLLDKPCDQGLLFCDMVLGILERLEDALGFEGGGAGKGLLSVEQVDDLWSQMDGCEGVASGYGVMRPADVKALFGKVGKVFERLSVVM